MLLPRFFILFFISLFASNLAYALTADSTFSVQAKNYFPVTQIQNSTLIVGSEQDFPPFAIGMTNETAGGFTVELWKVVAAEVGLNYTIRVLPFHQILQEYKTGKIDVLINLAQSVQRKQFSDFTVPHIIMHGGIFVRKGQGSIRSESDLTGKSIIVLSADLGHDYAVSKGWEQQLVLVNTAEEGFRLLASGAHDVMLLTKLAGIKTLQDIGLHNIIALKTKVGYSQKFSFAVHKNESELLAKINEGLALSKANGAYDTIYEKWFGIYDEKEIGLRELRKYIIPLVLIFTIALAYSFYRRREQLIIANKELLFQNEEKEKRTSELVIANKELNIAAIAFESQEGMFVTDANAVILRVNHAFIKITGYSAEESIGQTPKILSSGKYSKAFYSDMWESINNIGVWEGEIWNRHKSGNAYPEHLTITAVKDKSGMVSNYVATLTTIMMSQAASDEIKTLAYYDPLTSLPNRRLLLDRIDQALASSARSRLCGVILFIDLDHFKTINDTLGHEAGDIVLKHVATRLKDCVREEDTVARIGGDEFVVVLEGLREQSFEAAAQAQDVAEKIRGALTQPYQIGEDEQHSSPSIGATTFSGQELTAEELLKKADIAMYQAKASGRNTLRFFNQTMQESITVRAGMEKALRNAIENDSFQLHYQIQVNNTGQALGAEALIRWIHPELGIISPLNFIPLAEETGLILPIGQWMLNTACAQLKIWQQNSLTQDLILAVNVSAKQFHKDDFVGQVLASIARHNIDPTRLKLELTESMLIKNISDIITKMEILSEKGISFSLDDFGTGYSSLQYLKKLPLNQLKIDQSFVRDLATDDNDRAIVRTIITMAHSLNISVIAEGVETQYQKQYLLENGCAHYQGYLFSKPLPIDEFEALLKKG